MGASSLKDELYRKQMEETLQTEELSKEEGKEQKEELRTLGSEEDSLELDQRAEPLSLEEQPKEEPKAKAAPKKPSAPKLKAADLPESERFYRKGKLITREKANLLTTHFNNNTEIRGIVFDSDVAQILLDYKKRNGINYVGDNLGSIVQSFLVGKPELFQTKVPKVQHTHVQLNLAEGLWGYLDEIKQRTGDGTTDSDVINAVIRCIAKAGETS